jgi:hypothetical protein
MMSEIGRRALTEFEKWTAVNFIAKMFDGVGRRD